MDRSHVEGRVWGTEMRNMMDDRTRDTRHPHGINRMDPARIADNDEALDVIDRWPIKSFNESSDYRP